MLKLVAAVANNRIIGSKNDLPWYLPADLKHFKEITTHHTVLMGRKTYESIYARLKSPLPNRKNVVVSSSTTSNAPGVAVYGSLSAALNDHPDCFVIGGASIYEQTIDLADQLLITEVHAAIDGDTYFPAIDKEMWKEISRQDHSADEKNQFDYSYVTYLRR